MAGMSKWVPWTLVERAVYWPALFASVLVLGCASQSEETKQQLDSLNERILILQNDRDRLVERVDALEKHGGPVVPTSPVVTLPTRPALKVVHLAPETSEASNVEAESVAAPSSEVANAAHEPSEATSEQTSEATGQRPGASAAESGQRVVLYGEGHVSGVRDLSNQESPQ